MSTPRCASSGSTTQGERPGRLLTTSDGVFCSGLARALPGVVEPAWRRKADGGATRGRIGELPCSSTGDSAFIASGALLRSRSVLRGGGSGAGASELLRRPEEGDTGDDAGPLSSVGDRLAAVEDAEERFEL